MFLRHMAHMYRVLYACILLPAAYLESINHLRNSRNASTQDMRTPLGAYIYMGNMEVFYKFGSIKAAASKAKSSDVRS